MSAERTRQCNSQRLGLSKPSPVRRLRMKHQKRRTILQGHSQLNNLRSLFLKRRGRHDDQHRSKQEYGRSLVNNRAVRRIKQ